MVTEIGGSFIYTDRSKNCLGPKEREKYRQEVITDRNIVITNYDPSTGSIDKQGEGSIKVVVENGKTKISKKYSNKTSTTEGTVDLSSTRYSIFNALCSLDGDANTLSEKDLRNAKAKLKNNNVQKVNFDPVGLVLNIICKDGVTLRFDAESDAEMNTKQAQQK